MNAILTWNANIESDLAGYRVYHGISSLIYTPADTVTVLAPTTTYTYTNLDVGIIHYFNITAFDTTGNESVFGGEVTKFEPYPVYPLVHLMRERPRRLEHLWKTDMDDRSSGFIADVLGLNLPPVEPPPPETFPIYEAIGGFMIV